MSNSPIVSIILPTYNGIRFIAETLQSVLDQTYKNLEIIICDDCSTDNTVEIIKSFNDDRIKLFVNEQNLGIAENTNKALSFATGKYIMMQDHDDISSPYRAEYQVSFLEDHADVTGCGGSFKAFRDDKKRPPFIRDKSYIISRTVEDTELKQPFRFGDIFHPTIMYRRSILSKVTRWYSNELKVSTDLDFQESLNALGASWAVLGNILIHYRLHSSNTSAINKTKGYAEEKIVRKLIMKRYIKDATEEELELNAILGICKEPMDGRSDELILWFKKLIAVNSKEKYFNDDKWHQELTVFYLSASILSNRWSVRKAYCMYHSIQELEPQLISKTKFILKYIDTLFLVLKWKIRGNKSLGRRV